MKITEFCTGGKYARRAGISKAEMLDGEVPTFWADCTPNEIREMYTSAE